MSIGIVLGLGNARTASDNGMDKLAKMVGSKVYSCWDILPEGIDTFFVHSMGLRSALAYIKARPTVQFHMTVIEGVPDYGRWLRYFFNKSETVTLPSNVTCMNYLTGKDWGVYLTQASEVVMPQYSHNSIVGPVVKILTQ